MALNQKEVEHLALLARLGITEEEKEKFTHELSSILDYVAKLNEIDTKNIKPTSQVTGLSNVMREDQVKKSGCEKELVEAAPEHQGGCVKTKAILE